MKHDLDRRTKEVRPLRSGGGASEAVFVPAEVDAAEDDGWVLSLVYDADRDASDLLVLNAADFTGEPQAVVHLPQRVPFGFHGKRLFRVLYRRSERLFVLLHIFEKSSNAIPEPVTRSLTVEETNP